MTLKSLDLQVLLPKAQEIGRIQHVQQANEQNQQQGFAAHLLQESEIAQKTVQNLSQSREGKIQERTRENKQFSRKQSEKEDRHRQEKEPAPAETQDFAKGSPLGQVVDLKI